MVFAVEIKYFVSKWLINEWIRFPLTKFLYHFVSNFEVTETSMSVPATAVAIFLERKTKIMGTKTLNQIPISQCASNLIEFIAFVLHIRRMNVENLQLLTKFVCFTSLLSFLNNIPISSSNRRREQILLDVGQNFFVRVLKREPK